MSDDEDTKALIPKHEKKDCDHAHSHSKKSNSSAQHKQDTMNKLIGAFFVSFVFIGVELYGGWLAGSIAIFADAIHLASDFMGFAISMIALRLSQEGSTDEFTYGLHRAEIIGTLVSISTMWAVTLWLVV